jgi:peptidoglycan-N-acetylglucosamine deacetylase
MFSGIERHKRSLNRKPWPIPPLLKLSAGVHAASAAWAFAAPEMMGWAAASIALNHAAITAVGLWPRSQSLGSNWTRLPEAAAARGEVALTIDDGPDPQVTPKVLRLLDRLQTRATFFCIGQQAQTHKGLIREMVACGHGVQNHTHTHPNHFSLMGPRRMHDEIQRAQDRLADITGQKPGYFRAPAGLRNPFLAPVLHGLGLQLVSWTRRAFDTRESCPERVAKRLTRKLAAGDIVLLHDGHAARTASGEAVILQVLPIWVRACEESGLRGIIL